MQANVKLVHANDGSTLRKEYRGSAYFRMTVPQINTVIRYHKFNQEQRFENEFAEYLVVDVIQELQESWNGLYEERFTVLLKPV